ncbi:MAG: enoyl-CoA hydratase/isomerase family protein [Polyangiaceae bacterium]
MVDVVLAGPGKNALSTSVMRAALTALRAAAGEPVLLHGAGDAFSAGLNLKEIASLDAAGMTSFLELLDELIVALLTHDAPVVAWVNGHAIAGGAVLALACDERIGLTAESATACRIGLNEVAIGLTFPPRVLRLAAARLSPQHHARVLCGADLFSPSEALSRGLLDALADEATARARLSALAAHPRAAFVATRRALLRSVLELDPRDVDEYRERTLPAWQSPELRAAVLGTLARR